jgi:hypothetical protein
MGCPNATQGREKIRLIAVFLALDVNVIISDVDVLWLRDPLPYFAQYDEVGVVARVLLQVLQMLQLLRVLQVLLRVWCGAAVLKVKERKKSTTRVGVAGVGTSHTRPHAVQPSRNPLHTCTLTPTRRACTRAARQSNSHAHTHADNPLLLHAFRACTRVACARRQTF